MTRHNSSNVTRRARTSTKRKPQIHITPEPETLTKLKDYAKKDRRELANYCLIVLEKHVEDKEYQARSSHGTGTVATPGTTSVPPRVIQQQQRGQTARQQPANTTLPPELAKEIMSEENDGSWEGTAPQTLAGTKVSR